VRDAYKGNYVAQFSPDLLR